MVKSASEKGGFFALRSCYSKKAYSDRRRADEAISTMYTASLADSGTLHSYNCHFCGQFHVGHIVEGRDNEE